MKTAPAFVDLLGKWQLGHALTGSYAGKFTDSFLKTVGLSAEMIAKTSTRPKSAKEAVAMVGPLGRPAAADAPAGKHRCHP